MVPERPELRPYQTFMDVLRARASHQRDALAFRYLVDGEQTEETVTYGRLEERARAVAARLREEVAAGEPVLLLYPPGIEYVVGLLGCFLAGAVAVPAYPPRLDRHLQRLRGIVADCGARIALTTDELLPLVAAAGEVAGALRWIGTDGLPSAPRTLEFVTQPDAVALLQYTSGSTAAPRGVMLSHANLLSNCAAMRDASGASPDSVFVSWLPPYHDMGLIGGILGPLSVGFPSTILSPEAFLQRPARWLRALTRYGGTISGGPNFAFELCVRRVTREERRALDLSRWDTAFSGAERIRADTLARFTAAFAECGFAPRALMPSYGLAEATLCVSVDTRRGGPGEAPDRDGRRFVACGAPAAATRVLVVDPETAEPLPDGATGELWVAGPGVARGYWGRAEETEHTFGARLADGSGPYLRTGDLGFLADGQVVVVGRSKDLIVIRGRNHYPEDLEPTVERAHPAVRAGCVAAFPVEAAGEERLVVAAEVRPPDGGARRGARPEAIAAAIDVAAVVAAIREAVAREHELEVYAVALLPPGGVPKTTSGKLERRACRAAWEAGALPLVAGDVLDRAQRPERGEAAPPDPPGAPAGAPRTALEQLVAATMAELLDLDTVGVHDDFFDLGGQSLLATQLVARLAERLGREVPLRLAFEARTAAELAARLGDLPPAPAAPPLEPLPPDATPPLSFSQERMWFLHRLAPDSPAYNVGGALELEGPLDVAALGRALEALVARHSVLRTSFPLQDGAPRPVVRDRLPLPLRVMDLTGAPHPAAAAREQASAELARPFSLDGPPLIRVFLYRTGAERHVLAISLHHTVADGWSLAILVRELATLYAAWAGPEDRAGAPADLLPPPRVQYGDFAAWQRRWLSGERLEAQLAAWRERLAGAPALLSLPTDHPRPAHPTYRGALVPVELPADLIAALRALGRRHDATLFMVLLAGFQALLARHAGQEDVLVGCPVANRTHTAAEDLVGTLVNTLVLRTDVGGDPSFAALLARVRETALDAFAHQDLPFEQLVEALAPARTTRHAPLVQVMFDFQNIPLPTARTAGLAFRPLWLDRGGAQFDLSLYVLDAGTSHIVTAEYATDLFERDTVERLMGHYVRLLRAVVEDPDRPLAALPLVTPAERRDLVAAGVGPTLPIGERDLLLPAVARQVARRPGDVAVAAADGALTYAALERRANRLAHRLGQLGAGPGALVAVCLERTTDLVVALLAALKTGAAYVPLDPGFPPKRLALVLEDARPRVLLTDGRLLGRLPAVDGVRPLPLDDPSEQAALAALSDAPLGHTPAPDDLAYVIFTSGSTGRPKGVQVHHGALANLLAAMRRRPGFTAQDRLLAVTTVSFDISGLEVFLPLVAGGSVELVERDIAADGRRLRRLLEDRAPTVMQATPATWRMLIEAGWTGDGALTVLCGGEALPRDLADALLERAGVVWNLYGPTETTIWSAAHRVRPGEGPVPIGRPIANTRFYVLDARGELVPRGVTGELAIGGLGVAKGYLGRPELTADRFRPDPYAPPVGPGGAAPRLYRTGDAVRLHRDGRFEFLGRLDTQVKVRGYRVELGEIEATLARHPGVAAAAAVVREDLPGGSALVAYVVWRDPQRSAEEDDDGAAVLRDYLRERLPEYMVPAHLVSLPALPLTPNQKVDRKALPRPALAAPGARAVVPPEDALERRVLALWQEVLGRQDIGVTDDFFELGGHSLLAVRLFTLMADHLGVDVPLGALFEAPTVRRLAAVVRRQRPQRVAGRGPLAGSVVPIREADGWPPIFWLHTVGGGGGMGLFRYRRLAELLGDDVPSYGLREPDERCESIPELAAAHIAALRTVQRHGPYLLAGFCFGGTLAYEVARQLESAGEEVALLALIDSFPPNIPLSRATGLRYAARVARNVPGLVQNLVEAGPEWRRLFARRQLRRLAWTFDRLRGRPVSERPGLAFDDVVDVSTYPEGFRDIARLHWQAMLHYHPRPYGGPVVLFRPPSRPGLPEDRDRGWGLLAEVEVDELPGTHGDLLEESQVHALAAALRLRLAAALGRAAPSSADTGPEARPEPSRGA